MIRCMCFSMACLFARNEWFVCKRQRERERERRETLNLGIGRLARVIFS